jgi:hypothetical protein
LLLSNEDVAVSSRDVTAALAKLKKNINVNNSGISKEEAMDIGFQVAALFKVRDSDDVSRDSDQVRNLNLQALEALKEGINNAVGELRDIAEGVSEELTLSDHAKLDDGISSMENSIALLLESVEALNKS